MQTITKLYSVPLLLVALAGCNSGSSDQPVSVTEAHSIASDQTQSKVSVTSASCEDISDHIVDCKGSSKKQICVEICHRPPGNPENFKSMILPLKATLAHLKHGGPQHLEHDFLGPCLIDDEPVYTDPDEDTPIVDDDDLPVDEDDGPIVVDDDPVEVPVEELPIWCQRNYEIDKDCDGFHDSTGESLY